MNKVNIDTFNTQIADYMVGDDDAEIRNWASTQYGRRFTGIEANDEEMPTTCPSCGKESDDIAKRRRNAAYADDSLNWMVSCLDCFQLDTWQLDEMWDDYYGSVY